MEMHQQTPALRALQIASATKGRNMPRPDRVTAVITKLYEQARKEAQPVIFSRVAQLGVEYKLVERHFRPVVFQSPFVPPLQAPLYALGFARFFQGDFASAAYILFPQLEASLRHLLKARGADPTKRRDDAKDMTDPSWVTISRKLPRRSPGRPTKRAA
jgi:hypothetical protein